MGYIGLLLNDPYKIDRMVGDCLIYFGSLNLVFRSSLCGKRAI
jgi:hypothetical protein